MEVPHVQVAGGRQASALERRGHQASAVASCTPEEDMHCVAAGNRPGEDVRTAAAADTHLVADNRAVAASAEIRSAAEGRRIAVADAIHTVTVLQGGLGVVRAVHTRVVVAHGRDAADVLVVAAHLGVAFDTLPLGLDDGGFWDFGSCCDCGGAFLPCRQALAKELDLDALAVVHMGQAEVVDKGFCTAVCRHEEPKLLRAYQRIPPSGLETRP